MLAIDYGTNPLLTGLALIPFALAGALYAGHRKHLTLRIMTAVAELENSRDVLLTEGIYSRMRHPRYVEATLSVLGLAFFTNYLATYIAFLAMLPILHLVVLLEEKELKERFGAQYEEYCRRVPRYMPRIARETRKAA